MGNEKGEKRAPEEHLCLYAWVRGSGAFPFLFGIMGELYKEILFRRVMSLSRRLKYLSVFFSSVLIVSSVLILVLGPSVETSNQVVVILLDGARPDIIDQLIDEGRLSNIAHLVSQGVCAEYMVPVFPSLSIPGCSSIATGEYPGRTGMTGNAIHLLGEPLDQRHFASNSDYLLAEPLWVTAEESGLDSIVVGFPPCWPPQNTRGIIVSGGHAEFEGSLSQLYVTNSTYSQYPDSDLVDITLAEGWMNPPSSYSPLLETNLTVFSGPTYPVLILDASNDDKMNYDEAIIASEKDVLKAFAKLHVGEWSNWLYSKVSGQPSAFKFKLLHLTEDASELRMYKTKPYGAPVTQPGNLRYSLWNETGPFTTHDLLALGRGWIDEETYVEGSEIASSWFINATAHLMETRTWNLLFTTIAITDVIGHRFMGYVTPGNPYYNATCYTRYWDFVVRAYQLADQLVGAVMKRVGENANVIVVSDHGMAPVQTVLYPNSILMREGLLTLTKDGEVDWNTSKALFSPYPCHIYVNLRDRDPEGTVSQEDYAVVCQEIVEALYETVDPNTQKRPIALAMKRSDAYSFGLYGNRSGDVIFSTFTNYDSALSVRADGLIFDVPHPLWTGSHGHLPFLPEMHAIFIAAGPAFKSGVTAQVVRAVDVAPTISHLLGLPVSANAAGSVLLNALTSTPETNHESFSAGDTSFVSLVKALNPYTGCNLIFPHRYSKLKSIV